MIDLDLLESAVKKVWYTRTKEEDELHSKVIGELGILELTARLRQAEKDAARYRWLRDVGCFEGSADDLFHATPAETDAEFDRFMQCNK